MLHLAILRSPVAHARILSVDTLAAEAHPKVRAVVTGAMLEARGLAWMPTLPGDRQPVLATDKVRFQGQEVAFVVAEDRYAARDALELIDVEYEMLPPVVDSRRALDPDSAADPRRRPGQDRQPLLRVGDRRRGGHGRGLRPGRGHARAGDRLPPRPSGSAGDLRRGGRLRPRRGPAHPVVARPRRRTPTAPCWRASSDIEEHHIRVIAPDVGGGFGNKVPIYPGYVCAIVGSMVTGKPVKWTEDRTENLVASGFARDYVMQGEIAADRDGRILAVRSHVLADHGAFNGAATPTKFPGGFFGVFTGSYDLEAAFCSMTAVHTNKAPGGVAYACSFRIAEAVYLVERMVDILADELGMDPVALRLANFIQPDQFPYVSRTGWVYDSGNYPAAMAEALRIAGYDELRAEQAERRSRGELMGIGVAFFTEAVGAGPRKDMDLAGLAMSDGCELTINPTGTAVVRISVQTQGQGHETTFAQIVAQEIGIHPDDIDVIHGDTDNTPYGLGTYGSRSTPVSGAAAVLVARKLRDRCREIAAHLLEVSPDDLDWERGTFSVRGVPSASVTMPRDRGRGVRRPPTCPRPWPAVSRTTSPTARRTSPTRSAPTSAWSTSTPAPPW